MVELGGQSNDGSSEGFIEIMSEFEPDVVGWLDAKDAFKYFNRIKEAITK